MIMTRWQKKFKKEVCGKCKKRNCFPIDCYFDWYEKLLNKYHRVLTILKECDNELAREVLK
jgi:hypothetical protein